MAANLSISRKTGLAELAYRASGGTPWHHNGVAYPDDASTAHMFSVLDYQILTAPVQFAADDGTMVHSTERKVVYRRNGGIVELGCVGANFDVEQPSQVLELVEDACQTYGMRLETVGALFHGARLFAQCRIPGSDGEIVPGDKTSAYMTFATAVDGSLSRIWYETFIRAVCHNTLSAGMRAASKTGKLAKQSHKTEFDIVSLGQKLSRLMEMNDDYIARMRRLASMEVSRHQAGALLAELMGKPLRSRLEEKADYSRAERHILALFGGEAIGADLAGSTGWGLLNAVTEYADHHYGRTADARFVSAQWGPMAQLKMKTVSLLDSLLDAPARLSELERAGEEFSRRAGKLPRRGASSFEELLA